jgi:hypothetical protein
MAERHSIRQLMRLVRQRAPHRLVLWVRSLIGLWGTLTSPLRLRPAFLIVGAQRAGTTTLYRILEQHPAVARPTVNKGIAYFDIANDRGPRWYRGHFPLRWQAHRHHGPDVVTFESSGYYLFHPLAAGRIARELPDVKVVVMVREPVERAYSAHRHEMARGYEKEPFEVALELEPERTLGEAERIIADPAYESFHHRHHAYLARSRYCEQIERFVTELGPDRVHIVDADAFFLDPVGEFELLRSWLGLPAWQPEKVERWNSRPRSPMPAELRARLDRYFEPYDARLAEQMGRVPSWRVSVGED